MTKALRQELDTLIDSMWDDLGWREDNPGSTREDCERYALEDIVEAGPNHHDTWPSGWVSSEEEKQRESWRRIYREAKKLLEG